MLMIPRHANESIMIGDDVEIVVTSIRAARVRLTVKLAAIGGRITFEDSFNIEVGAGDVFSVAPVSSCTVGAVKGDKAVLGIDAPKHLSIHRREVYDAIRRQGRGDDRP